MALRLFYIIFCIIFVRRKSSFYTTSANYYIYVAYGLNNYLTIYARSLQRPVPRRLRGRRRARHVSLCAPLQSEQHGSVTYVCSRRNMWLARPVAAIGNGLRICVYGPRRRVERERSGQVDVTRCALFEVNAAEVLNCSATEQCSCRTFVSNVCNRRCGYCNR